MNDDAPPPYWKLLPEPSTPDCELCDCADEPVVKLLSTFSSNPLHCAHCGLEYRLNRLRYSEHLFEKIHNWNRVYGSVCYLWLDSGDYESWALEELENIDSYANRLAVSLLPELNKYHRTYFQIFQRAEDDDWQPRTSCPACEKMLSPGPNNTSICEACSIVV